MNRMPPMPLHVSDLMADSDCRKMTDAEFGRYFRLLCRQWLEGVVPDDPMQAIRDAGLDPDAGESVRSLLSRKFTATEGGLANLRCDEIRAGVLELSRKRRMNGSIGGRSKGAKRTPKPKKKTGKSGGSSTNPVVEVDRELAGFTEFYQQYPRKIARKAAESAWKKNSLHLIKEQVMEGLRRCVASQEWQRHLRDNQPRFIPHPSTWLNRAGWEDQLDLPKGNADPFLQLNPGVVNSLLDKVKELDPGTLHARGRIETERALRVLAKREGYIV